MPVGGERCPLATTASTDEAIGRITPAYLWLSELDADNQGRGTGALNFERIYSTTVPAEEVARALADHFRAQEFEAQVYSSNENRTMQAHKESLWRQLLGAT
jgi:hypothetical protein